MIKYTWLASETLKIQKRSICLLCDSVIFTDLGSFTADTNIGFKSKYIEMCDNIDAYGGNYEKRLPQKRVASLAAP
jgi:hypothetical protein